MFKQVSETLHEDVPTIMNQLIGGKDEFNRNLEGCIERMHEGTG